MVNEEPLVVPALDVSKEDVSQIPTGEDEATGRVARGELRDVVDGNDRGRDDGEELQLLGGVAGISVVLPRVREALERRTQESGRTLVEREPSVSAKSMHSGLQSLMALKGAQH